VTAVTSGSPARRTRVRVRYADTDQMGIVYYANYFVWFEVARSEWLRDAGWTYRDMEAEGVSLPVIEAHCEYRHSARYDDEIEIATRATLLSAVRIRFDYELVRLGEVAVAAVGHTVHAALGRDLRPCRLPGRVRDLVRSGGLPEGGPHINRPRTGPAASTIGTRAPRLHD
jgi:acyl-CoA thioester hydrolase